MSPSAQTTPFAPFFIDDQARPANGDPKCEVPYIRRPRLAPSQRVQPRLKTRCRRCGPRVPVWEQSSLTQERDLFMRAAALLTTEQGEGRRSDETAATYVVVQLNISLPTELLCTPATLVTELKGETSPSHIHGGQMLVERRVQGVVYTPRPMNRAALRLMLVQALNCAVERPAPPDDTCRWLCHRCGNAVDLTTSEVSPRSQHVIAEPFHEVAFKTTIP